MSKPIADSVKPRKDYRLWGLGGSWRAALLAVVTIGMNGIIRAQEPFRTGGAFEQVVRNSPFEVNWVGNGIRDQLVFFCESQRVALWFDRRIDPDLPIDLAIQNGSLEQILWLAAEQHRLAVCRINDGFYIGPPQCAARLPELLNSLVADCQSKVTKASLKKSLLETHAIQAKLYSQPREILSELAGNRFEIQGLDQIPLDVWPAVRFSEQPLIGDLALICFGFEKWLEVDDLGKLKIVDVPELDPVSREYRFEKKGSAKAKLIQDKFSSAVVELTGKSLRVEADWQSINHIERLLAFDTEIVAAPPGVRRYSLTTEASRGNLLATIATQMKRKLEIESGLEVQLEETIKLVAQDKTLEELMEMTLTGTNLKFEVTATHVKILLRK